MVQLATGNSQPSALGIRAQLAVYLHFSIERGWADRQPLSSVKSNNPSSPPSLDGRGEGEGGPVDRSIPAVPSNGIHHSIDVLKHVIVPKSQDSEPVAHQNAVAPSISWGVLCVLSAIELNHNPLFSKQTKSTMKLPTGCCLLNFRPSSCFALSLLQRSFSASVEPLRRILAYRASFPANVLSPSPQSPPARGGE